MKAELLSENTYKITLNHEESAALPAESDKEGMHSFICNMIERLENENIRIPEGKLLAEMFLCSDGNCVFFITSLGQDVQITEPLYYCCDIKGIDALIALCTAFARRNIQCSIYCGNYAEEYRLIFLNPDPFVCHICTEYGDFSEITRLFASQTAEYLTEITHFQNI